MAAPDPSPDRSPEPEPVPVDLADFDAVGIVSEVLVALRAHTMRIGADSAATVSAPAGWHRAVMTARDGGHVVLSVRYDELSPSRLRNVADALGRRGWQLDEDGEGSTVRFPPGTDASTPAFELLGALTVSGAPGDVRRVTARDGTGAAIDLHAGLDPS
jgi:hypothetical protein